MKRRGCISCRDEEQHHICFWCGRAIVVTAVITELVHLAFSRIFG